MITYYVIVFTYRLFFINARVRISMTYYTSVDNLYNVENILEKIMH